MRTLVLGVLLGSAACGGDSSGPISMQDAEAVCDQLCEHDIMCGDTDPLATCVANCTADLSGGGLREDAVNDIANCVTDLACTADEDTCLARCSPTGAHEDYESSCRAKAAECGGSGSAVDSLCETTPNTTNDDIGFTCLFTPQVMNELSACFERPCTELEMCFQTVLAKYDLSDG